MNARVLRSSMFTSFLSHPLDAAPHPPLHHLRLQFLMFFSISFFLSSLCFIFVRACVVSFVFFFSTLITSHLFYSIDSWLLPSCSTICFILSFSWCRDNNMWAFCYIFYYARFTLEHRWDDAWKVSLHFKTTALLCFMCVIFTKLTVRFL